MNQDIKERIKQIQNGIVPEGYKKTKVAIIPEEWNVRRVKDFVCLLNDKHNPEKSGEFFPCIELEHIESDTGMLTGITDTKTVKSLKNKFKEKNILYGKLRPYLRKYYFAKFNGVCSTEIWVLSPKNKNIDEKYLFYLVQTEYFNYHANISTGSSMPRADWNYVSLINFGLPSLYEQQRIASILETWDRAIELKEKLIQEKQTQKKVLINMIMKFDAIEPEPLGKYLKLQGGFAFKSSDYKEHGIPIIRISNIQDKIDINNNIVFSEKRAIEQRFIIKYGDILIAMSGATTGKTGVYRHTRIGYLNQRVGKLIPRKELLFKEFLVHLIQTNEFKNKLKKLLVAGAQPNISPTDIESIRMSIPPLPEQQHIAKILSTADREIELLKEEVELLKQQKKGLMQLLLTGIIRV